MRTLVTAIRGHIAPGGPWTEAEPVLVDTDTPDVIVLELDNGELLELDAREFRTALGEAA